jgi:hypothetical protein
MEHSFLRKFGVLLLLAAAGAVSFGLLYEDVAPRASVDLSYDRAEIMNMASAYMIGQGFDLKDYQQDAWFSFDGSSHLFLQRAGGVRKAREIIRADSLSTHHWYVTWYDRKVPQSQTRETYQMWISPRGRILGFEHMINDSVALPSIGVGEAERLARQFLDSHGVGLSGFSLKTSSATTRPKRVDHKFTFAKSDSTFDESIWVSVNGNSVYGYRENFGPGAEFQSVLSSIGTTATFAVTGSFATIFLLFFFLVVLFLKKYHEGEVGTRTALLVFLGLLIVSVAGIFNQYPILGTGVQMGDLNKYHVRIVMFIFNVFIIQVFLSVMVFAGWSVGESSSRTTWPGKMTAVDSSLFRKFFTQDVGEGILRGYAWGLILLGGYTLFLYLLITQFGVGLYAQGTLGSVEAYLPSLQPLFQAAGMAIFAEIIFRLFFISYLKELTNRTWVGVIVSTVIWTAAAFTMWELPYGFLRLQYTFLALFVSGLVFSFLFLRYDLLTCIMANFVISFLNAAVPLLSSTGLAFQPVHVIILVVFAFPLLVAVGGLLKRERFEFTPQTVPAHILRISQRERMAKELEIARAVQMSLLPKTNPIVEGYDIAGTCIPALEVGGDYYDFVNLAGKKIGIAIGDVSGKGVPAAIYMTLTKGILQSNAEESVSPKKVLSKVNSLMYRTIERSSFVSMFYAVLDMQRGTIRFARAGQCPVILAQHADHAGSFLSPKGMALGLERGVVFDSVLEEMEIPLQSGEVLVFYTDGFTEAMNDRAEEFGEARLVNAVARHRRQSADEIIRNLCDEVKQFTGATPQHDDMTMVVVKVGQRNRVS